MQAPPKLPAEDAALDPHAAMLLGLPGWPSSSSHAGAGPGGGAPPSAEAVAAVDPVAERRRQKARAQLDAKLAAMESAQAEQWDDDELVADASGGSGGGAP